MSQLRPTGRQNLSSLGNMNVVIPLHETHND
jgi:hypothetical protein